MYLTVESPPLLSDPPSICQKRKKKEYFVSKDNTNTKHTIITPPQHNHQIHNILISI